MVEISELSDSGFKLPIINMQRALLEKVNMQNKMCNMKDDNFKDGKKMLFIYFKNEKKRKTLQLKWRMLFLQPRNSELKDVSIETLQT